MLSKSLVQRYIQPSRNEAVQIKGNYRTDDIVSVVLATDKTAWQNTAELSKHIQYTSIKDVCSQIWYFLKNNIKYQEDTPGQQLVKTPSALWNDRKGDCKSYSIFTASILRNLGIPYSYRFVSFSGTETPTHVYVVAHDGTQPIIIDAVWSSFNSQKQYTFKKDYRMEVSEPGLYAVSGIGKLKLPTVKKAGVLNIVSHNAHDLDIAIARQRIEIDRANMLRAGSTLAKRKADGYTKVLQVLDKYQQASANNDFKAMATIIKTLPDNQYRDFLTKGYQTKINALSGIGKFGLSDLKPKNVIKTATEQHKLVLEKAKPKNIVSTIKTVVDMAGDEARRAAERAKGIWENTTEAGFKVINKVRFAMAKPMLEILLPVASPMFLYTFSDGSNLSEKANNKRKANNNLLKVIAHATGATDAQIQGILRNAILKKTKKQPEEIIEGWRQAKTVEGRTVTVTGIGEEVAPTGTDTGTGSNPEGTAKNVSGWMSMITSCADSIAKLIAEIRKMTGKHPDGGGKGDYPSEADFNNDGTISDDEKKQYDDKILKDLGVDSKDSGSFCKKRE